MTKQNEVLEPPISVDSVKLSLFRLIDQLSMEALLDLEQELQEKLDSPATAEEEAKFIHTGQYDGPLEFEGDIEDGFDAMFNDEAREREALEWSEGTLNTKELTSDTL